MKEKLREWGKKEKVHERRNGKNKPEKTHPKHKKIVNVFEAMKSLCFSIKNNQARAVLPRLQPRTVCSGWLRNAGALPTKILQADLWAVSEPVPVRRISGRRKSERLVNKIVIEIIYEFYKSINHIRVVSLGGLWYSERFDNLKFLKNLYTISFLK